MRRPTPACPASRRSYGAAGAEGSTAGGWDVRQRHAAAGGATRCSADLENGVTSLWLTVGRGRHARSARWTGVLDGVYLDLAPVVLDAGSDVDAAARELLRLYEERGVAPDAARGNLGADPLGHEARTGARASDFAPVAALAATAAPRSTRDCAR